jgi:hypothetical protein
MDAFGGDLMRASLPVSSGVQRLLARGLGLAPFGLMLDEGVVEVGATMMTSIWGGARVAWQQRRSPWHGRRLGMRL